MNATILEEFIVELKQIECNMNNSAFVPSLRKDQVWIINEIIKMAEQKVLTSKNQTLTRFEVINEHGRAYTDYYCKVELSYQDDDRTLKVFIKPINKQD
jgi:hypothetical protein